MIYNFLIYTKRAPNTTDKTLCFGVHNVQDPDSLNATSAEVIYDIIDLMANTFLRHLTTYDSPPALKSFDIGIMRFHVMVTVTGALMAIVTSLDHRDISATLQKLYRDVYIPCICQNAAADRACPAKVPLFVSRSLSLLSLLDNAGELQVLQID